MGPYRRQATRRQALLAWASAAAAPRAVAAEAKHTRRKKRRRGRHHDAGGGPGGTTTPGQVALGAYVPQALDDEGTYQAFTAAIGRSPAYLVWYEAWSKGAFGRDQQATLATIEARRLTPVLAWEPYAPDGPTVDQPHYRLATIVAGHHDAYIDSWAQGLAAYGKPVFLNFGHEMNGDWSPWGVGVNGNVARDFVAAWRYLHARFAAAGASNVRWVWVPNVIYDTVPATLAEVYPGDAYVDWLGMDGYNWGTAVYWVSCPCQSWWQSFAEVFDATYQQLVALAAKPIMIGETACAEQGGSKAAWIGQALGEALPATYPQIRAVTWFDAKATGFDTNAQGHVGPTATVDWRITSSDSARAAFRTAVADQYYQRDLTDI